MNKMNKMNKIIKIIKMDNINLSFKNFFNNKSNPEKLSFFFALF